MAINNINTLAKALGTSADNLNKSGVHIEQDGNTITIWATAYAATSGTVERFSKTFIFPVELDTVEDWLRDLSDLILYA